MRLLLDENVPLPSAYRLRQAGHDVAAVAEDTPGVDDQTVIARAISEQRILVTFDRDIGQLVYHHGMPAPPAIIHLRFRPRTLEEPADRVLELFLKVHYSWQNTYTRAGRMNSSQKPLP